MIVLLMAMTRISALDIQINPLERTDAARGIRAIHAFFRKRPTSACVSRAVPAAAAATLHVKSLELGAVARIRLGIPWHILTISETY